MPLLALTLLAPGCSALLGVDFDAKGDAARADAGAADPESASGNAPPDGVPPPPSPSSPPLLPDGGVCTTCDAGAVVPGAIPFVPAPLALGVSAGCARSGDVVKCWGAIAHGASSATAAATIPGLVAIATEDGATCALANNGIVSCWGAENGSGQQGQGTYDVSASPKAVVGLQGARAIASGAKHFCALLVDGSVACWGDDAKGQIGDGTSGSPRPSPTKVLGLTDAIAIAAGATHTCAVRAGGTAVCWGSNEDGRLGSGSTTTTSEQPVTVKGLTGVVALSAHGNFTCARRANGTAACWGWGLRGNLGDGDTKSRSTPVEVSVVSGIVDLSAGDGHTCARLATGTLACWGGNDQGQLGNGSIGPGANPSSITTIPNADHVVAGSSMSCATAGAAAYCWGSNFWGALGTGKSDSGYHPSPEPVVGL